MANLPGIGDYEQHVDITNEFRKITPTMAPGNLGATLEHQTEAVSDAVDRKNRADGAVYAANQMADVRTQTAQNLVDAKQNAADDGSGFTKTILDGYDKQAQTLMEQAKSNPYAAQALDSHLRDFRSTLAQHSLEWEAQAGIAYRTNSIKQNVDKLASVVEADPGQWQSSVNEQAHAIENSNLDPETRIRLGTYLGDTLTQHAATGLARANPQGVLDSLKDPANAGPIISHLQPQQLEQVRAFASGQLAQNVADPIVQAFRDQGPTGGAKALAAVDKMNQPDDIKAMIYSHVQAGVSEWRQEAQQTHGQAIMGLEEHLASGQTTPQDRSVALGLYHSGAWTAAQTGETIGRIEKAQQKQVDDDAMFKYTQAAYQNGTPLDPKNTDIKKGIDAVFTTQTNHVAPGSPEWINRAADIAAKTGVTPDSAISWSRTQLVGGDPQSAAQAANAIQRMQDANPRGTPFALDDKDRAMARLINDATTAGTAPQVAVENARKVTALADADVTRLNEIYHLKQIPQKSEGDLKNLLKDTSNGFRDHFWQGIPDVPPQMTGQFEQLRSTYFKLTNGNVDQASKLALQDLKNSWGISQVNGTKEFMQYAPEALHPGMTTDMVRSDMEASAKGHTDDPTKVRLLTIPDTYQSGGERWGLGIPDKFGAYSALTDAKGRVIPYQLPTGTQALLDAKAKASAEGMAKLHELQGIEREREKNQLGEIYNQGRQGGY